MGIELSHDIHSAGTVPYRYAQVGLVWFERALGLLCFTDISFFLGHGRAMMPYGIDPGRRIADIIAFFLLNSI